MRKEKQFLVALGGNLPSSVGTPDQTLRAALGRLEESGATVVSTSRFYQTPCFPAGCGPDYVNAAVELHFDGSADALLETLHAIEAHFGRERTERWGRRTLDLDLIAAGDAVLPDLGTYRKWHALEIEAQSTQTPDRLILPHPRIQDRAFVLVPLSEIAPNWRHPVLNLTVTEMLEALTDKEKSEVVPL